LYLQRFIRNKDILPECGRKEKTEFVHYVQKMKLAMNSIIHFHVIILIIKENCTLNKSLEKDIILWNSRKLWHLKINTIFKNYVDLLSS